MKKIILRGLGGVAAIVAVLAAIVVTRTLMLPPPLTINGATVAMTIPPEAAQRAAEHLSQAIQLKTISWQRGATGPKAEASAQALGDFRDFITSTYPAFSAASSREIVSDYSLLFTWKGTDENLKPVLLMSHMDVVPVVPGTEANWTHPPFAGEIADGIVWGRGAIDCKGSLIAMLEAADALAAKGFQPKRSIMFAFGHDEEISGLNGNRKIAAMLKERGVKLAFVSDEGGMMTEGVVSGVKEPVALIGVAEKGYMTLKLTAHAKGGHSSMPPAQGETAIGRVMEAMTATGNAPFESGLDETTRAMLQALAPAMPFVRRMAFANLWLFEPMVQSAMEKAPQLAAQLHTTIAPTMINAGIKENVLPPEASGIMNFRLHQRDTIESATAHVVAAVNDDEVDVEQEGSARNASAISNLKGESYALLRQSITHSYPDALVTPNLTVAGTDSRYYLPLTENVFRFVPIRVDASELAGFHATNERIRVASLAEAVSFYTSLMQNLDAPGL
ncbi:MAG: M20 family peptidase [Parvibaculum sp.]